MLLSLARRFVFLSPWPRRGLQGRLGLPPVAQGLGNGHLLNVDLSRDGAPVRLGVVLHQVLVALEVAQEDRQEQIHDDEGSEDDEREVVKDGQLRDGAAPPAVVHAGVPVLPGEDLEDRDHGPQDGVEMGARAVGVVLQPLVIVLDVHGRVHVVEDLRRAASRVSL